MHKDNCSFSYIDRHTSEVCIKERLVYAAQNMQRINVLDQTESGLVSEYEIMGSEKLLCECVWNEKLFCECMWSEKLLCECMWSDKLLCEYRWSEKLLC